MQAESKDVKAAAVERSATTRGKGERDRPNSAAAEVSSQLQIARPRRLDARSVAQLQRFAGNRAVRHLLRQPAKSPTQLRIATQPTATKAPADPVLDKLVESTVEELDGSPSFKMLLSLFLAAGKRGQLKEFGEALRSKPHKRKGDYLERFIEGIEDEGSQKSAVWIVGQFERAGISFTLGLKEYTQGDKVAAELKTGNEGDPSVTFFRQSKTAPIRAFINGADGGTYEFTFPWNDPTFRPRIVERNPGARGKMLITFTARREKDLILTWQIDEFTEFPFMEGATSHIVQRKFKTKRHRFFIAGPQIGVHRPMFNAPELPDDAIFPPKWEMVQVAAGPAPGSGRIWMRRKDRRAIRANTVEFQQSFIETQKLLERETAIAYVETIIAVSPLGPYYFGAEAILGRSFIRGEKLSTEERLLLGFLSFLGMVAQRGARIRDASPKARPAALSEEKAALRRATGLSEDKAGRLIEVGGSISAEEQAFLRQLEADVRAGKTIDQARLQRLGKIVQDSTQKIRPPTGGGQTQAKAGTTPKGTRQARKVPGLYESIDPTRAPQGYAFRDTTSRVGGEVQIRTEVTFTDAGGKTYNGHMVRGLDPATGEFIFHEAFLEQIPRQGRVIAMQPEMISGRGTPLEAYMTMRQMHLLEAKAGIASIFATPRTVRMSTIVNDRTILDLAQAQRANPKLTLDEAILNTHSVQYANNSITQGGGRITRAHVEGGWRGRASDYGTPDELAKRKIPADQEVLWGFDIELTVEPAASGAAKVPAPRSTPGAGRR